MLIGKYINKYYKKYFWRLLFGVAFLVFIDVVQLFVPQIVGDITNAYDDGTLTSQFINQSAISLVVISFTMFAGRFIWRMFIMSSSYRITGDLREEMFNHTVDLSSTYYHQNKVGALMSYYTSDIETLEENYSWGLVALVDSSFLGILTFIKMGLTNWLLTLICAVPLGVLVFTSYFIDKKMGEVFKKRQDAFENMENYAQELFTGIRVIKAFCLEAAEALNFKKVNEETKNKDVELVSFQAFLDMMVSILVEGRVCVGLLFGGIFIYENVIKGNDFFALSRGDMLEFILYFDTIIWPMIALGWIISLLSRAKTSLKRISSYLDETSEITNGEVCRDSLNGKINFSHLSFAYPSAKYKILDDISLEINPGEHIGIVGKVGSGKSTLLHLLLHEYNIEKQSIFIDDIDLMNFDIANLRTHISISLQTNVLFSNTIKNNIAFGLNNIDEEEIKKAAEFACLDEDIRNFNEGYNTIIGERGLTLSGGQKQRLSLARAFINHSDILLLDDPLSAVDIKTEARILKNIAHELKDTTVILASSRVSSIMNFDKVIVLDEGKVVGYDSPDNLMNNCSLFVEMASYQRLERDVEEYQK